MTHKYFEKQFLSGEDYGMFFKKDVKEGTVVHSITGNLFNRRTRDTIQIENGQHVYDPIVIWINHGFEKTSDATVKRNTKDQFVTIKEVKAGDQVLFDYTLNEDYISSPFEDFYTKEPVKYGVADAYLIHLAETSGFSFDVYDPILSQAINESVTDYVYKYPVESSVYDVLNSDDPVNVALKKLPALPTQAVSNLFGKNASLFNIWIESM